MGNGAVAVAVASMVADGRGVLETTVDVEDGITEVIIGCAEFAVTGAQLEPR
jgi:hypothetical protein